jgi:cell division transport system permease protein
MVGRITFFIAEALRALRRSAAPSVAAIVTIVVTTLLLGVLIPVLKASASKTEDVRSQIALRVFLYDDATKSDISKLKGKLDAIPHVTGTEFVSKKEAIRILSDRVSGDLRASLNNDLKRNPLPASFNVSLDDPDNLESVRSAISPPGPSGKPKAISPVISDVTDSRDEATKIRAVTGAIKIILFVITALLLIASLMLVGNTIRLSIYARRREVEVMRLVGATSWFIRWPFMFEGLMVGFAGAAIAVGVMWLGKVTIVDPLSDNFNLVANLDTMSFVPLVAILVASAMAVSALGSGITLRRFLRI